MTKTKQPKNLTQETLDAIRIYGQPLTNGVPFAEGHIIEPHADYGTLLDDIAEDTNEIEPKKK